MRGAVVALGLAAGCGGGGDGFTDAGDDDPGIDAPAMVDGPPARGDGSVRVFGRDDGRGLPLPDAEVLSHDHDGVLIDRTTTDADGVATLEVIGGGSVTVVFDDDELATVMAVEPGDALVFGDVRANPDTEGSATVTLPAGPPGASYALMSECVRGAGSAPAITVTLVTCDATRPGLAILREGTAITGFLYLPAVSVADGGALDLLAEAWATPGALALDLDGFDGATAAIVYAQLTADGRIVTETTAAINAPGTSAAGTVAYPTGVGDAPNIVVAILGPGRGYRSRSQFTGDAQPSIAVAAADLLAIPPLPAGSPTGATWPAITDGDHDGVIVELVDFEEFDGIRIRGTWAVVAPPDAGAVALPELPADLAEAWQPNLIATRISVVDTTAATSYAAFRADAEAGRTAGWRPAAFDGAITVRAAGTSGGI